MKNESHPLLQKSCFATARVSSVATNSSLRSSQAKKPVNQSTVHRKQGEIKLLPRSVVDGSIPGKPFSQKEQPRLPFTVESSDEERTGATGFDEPRSRSQSVEFTQAGQLRSS